MRRRTTGLSHLSLCVSAFPWHGCPRSEAPSKAASRFACRRTPSRSRAGVECGGKVPTLRDRDTALAERGKPQRAQLLHCSTALTEKTATNTLLYLLPLPQDQMRRTTVPSHLALCVAASQWHGPPRPCNNRSRTRMSVPPFRDAPNSHIYSNETRH